MKRNADIGLFTNPSNLRFQVKSLSPQKAAGNLRAANIVRLAAFVARSGVVSMETLRNCIRQKRGKKPKLIPLNMKAVDAGEQAAPK